MLERNEKGKQVRRYFIEVEKRYKQIVQHLSEEEKLKLQLFSKDALEVATAHNRLVEIEIEKATVPLLEDISKKGEVIEQQDKQLEIQKPFVQTAMKLQNANNTVSFEQSSKLFSDNGIDIGRNTLMKMLREHGILMENNSPYERYKKAGLFKVKTVIKENHYGTRIIPVTRVTGKGLIFIDKKLREWFDIHDSEYDINISMEEIFGSDNKYAWLDTI